MTFNAERSTFHMPRVSRLRWSAKFLLIAIAAVLFALPMGLLAACAVEVTADALAARRKAGSWTNALIEAWGESAGSTTADAGRGKPVAAEAAAYEADAALLNRIA